MTTRVWRYRHYGLTIEANVAVPGLPAVEAGRTDVHVEVVRVRKRPEVDSTWTMIGSLDGAWRASGPAGGRLRLRFEGPADSWAEFQIDNGGGLVRVTVGEAAVVEDACEMLIANIFSCVLAQRGLTCLHASVVAVEDRVIALIGAKGAGKSTLALALAQRGGELLSDDVAAISWRDGVCGVAVGRPALRMRSDSAASLGTAFTGLRPVWVSATSPESKRHYEPSQNPGHAARSWRPLAGVFILRPRGNVAAPHARLVPPGELLPTLLANRHMALFLDRAGHRRDFDCLAALVRQVPGRELLRPDNLQVISLTADAVAAEIGPLTSYDRRGRAYFRCP